MLARKTSQFFRFVNRNFFESIRKMWNNSFKRKYHTERLHPAGPPFTLTQLTLGSWVSVVPLFLPWHR